MTNVKFDNYSMSSEAYKRALHGVQIYYERFDTDKSLTIRGAARLAGSTGLDVNVIMAYGGTGMPADREDAQRCLERVVELKGRQ